MHPRAPREYSTRAVLASTYLAASGALLLTFPLDTVKTRMQTSHASPAQCARALLASGGVPKFYSGIAPALASSAPARAATMSLYTTLVPRIARRLGYAVRSGNDRPVLPTFLAGCAAGSLSCTVTGPFEFAKTAAQVQSALGVGGSRPGALQAVRSIWRRGGARMLYGGVEYQCARDALGSGVYFAVYETLKRALSRVDAGEPPSALAVAVAGAACGAASWLVVYPLDTMKSTFQKQLYAAAVMPDSKPVERPRLRLSRDMYRGLGFSVARTSLNGVFIFSLYESLLCYLPL